MRLSNLSVYPPIIPDESVQRELQGRFHWASIEYRPDRGCLCLVERGKPEPGWPDGYPAITYELRDSKNNPRQADRREIDSVAHRVFGAPGVEANVLKHLREQDYQKHRDQRLDRHDFNMYMLRRMHQAHKRSMIMTKPERKV